MDTGDIPPPHLTTSINDLRRFSAALSAFITRYDEFHTHLNFIDASIDSKLPHHLVENTNPNLSNLTQLLETVCDQTITASPEACLLERNPKETASDSERSHEETVVENLGDETIPDVTETVVSEQNPNRMASNCDQSHENVILIVSESLEQINVSKKPEQAEEIDVSEEREETVSETSCDRGTAVVVSEAVALVQTANGMATNCEQSHENVILIVSESVGETSGSKKPEQTDNCKKPEELDTLMIPEEIDTSDEPEETVPETSCDQTIAVVPEAIVSVQNTNGMAADCEKSIDDTGVSMQPKQIDICKNPEETVVLKKPEEFDALMVPEETVSKTCCDQTTSVVQEAIVSKQIHENVLKKSEQTDICNNPEETVLLKKHEKTEARRKFLISVLEPMCQSMRFKEVRGHIAAHISEMINFREEIAKALKLANDPAKLVLTCIGRFFAQGSSTYCNPRQSKRDRRRMAAVLILECFVMISSDIAIVKRDREHAEKASVDWKKRMMEEGGFGHTDLLDARGLLLLISGFGFQDHVFTIQDIMDLIRASNVKEISTALRHSVFLIPKIPKVIYWMMQSNLEVEAVDLAYTFELEDTCHPQNILTTYLQNKIKDFNSSPLEKLKAVKQHLFDLKSVKKCLESHNVDPSTLLPDFRINEKIQNLKKEVKKLKSIQKRKSLGKPVHQKAKHASFAHENMPLQQKPIDQTMAAAPEAIVSEQNPNITAANHEQSHENISKKPAAIDISKKPEQTDICRNPSEINTSKKHEETGTGKKAKEMEASKEFLVSRLQYLCQSTSHKELKWHVAEHISEMTNLRVEIANALRLAEDPANFVLNSIGSFFVWTRNTFCKGLGPHWDKKNLGRQAAVLILECFVMISSDITIVKRDRERAEKASVDWKKRMMKEGGFGHTNEVDARGLLLLISGFGFQEHVFTIQDIMDLIRASNVKEISTALSHSVFLIPKIPKVIYWMMQSNLEVEAVDLAYTFELEDMCHPQNILTTYLQNKIKDFNSSPLERLEAVKQHLFDLKSVKQCLESHNIDPSTLLPDFKINEKIQNFKKEENKLKSIQKSKSLEKPIHQKAKHASFAHDNIQLQQKPIDQTMAAAPEAIVSEQNPYRTAANREQSHENISKKPAAIDLSKKLEQTDICRNPSEIITSKKHEETGSGKKAKETEASKKFLVSRLQYLCQNTSYRELKWHVAEHISEMSNLRVEIANALRLAEDPANFVLNNIGRFFLQAHNSFCKGLGPQRDKEILGRQAAVLILECFVMISSDGIEIAKRDQATAAQAAVDWRKRMIREGGLCHADEVDARGLLLLISGFGIQDHDFNIQEIMDLIRASNVKGISTALRCSCFLIPKIPKVIYLMVKNNLEIEAVDIAYTFGMEDMCHAQDILTAYLHNKLNEFQNCSSLERLGALKQHLLDLKSVKQCLESHNVDPSTLLPDFKINEKIQNLEKTEHEWKLIQKRKSLENPIHQETKRACYGHQNIPRPVSNGLAGGFSGSYDQTVRMAKDFDASKNPEEIDALKNHAETDSSKKPEETVPETSCDQNIAPAPEAIVSKQNPNGMAANFNQSHELMRTPENHEEVDASKNPERIDVSKKLEQTDIFNKPAEIDILKKPEQTDICRNPKEAVPDTSCDRTTPTVSKQNPYRMATNPEQSHENVPKKPSVFDISKKPEHTVICKNLEVIDASKKSMISELESLCQSMRSKEMKWHVAAHIFEMSNLRVEIANALRLAADPANLVINCIGRFFVEKRRTFLKGLGPHHEKQNVERKAAVLILECFLMISSDDGIEIAKNDQESAAKAAFDWRKRMIKEGGLGHADEVDARGLLLLISGFGIQDHVFKIQDIVDLIRVSNVKGISTALRRSVFLLPKIPEVIYLMVKNNMEIKAVDTAYTFGLEDTCNPRNILTTYLLTTYLHKKLKIFQNCSSVGKLGAVRRYLSELKSLNQCLESHNVDPSMLLPDFKINEMIQNLEKEEKELKPIGKRKSSEKPIHQKAKRACVGPENMPHQQTNADRHGMNQYTQSSQPSTGSFDSHRNLGNSCTTNHSPTYVYNASAMPGSVLGPVPNIVAGGFPGSYDQTAHTGNVQPYGWYGPYVQLYSTHGQTFDSQPYPGPMGSGQPASFPGFPERPGPSSDLYGFAEFVEKDPRRPHT